jgi:hypothetical protein
LSVLAQQRQQLHNELVREESALEHLKRVIFSSLLGGVAGIVAVEVYRIAKINALKRAINLLDERRDKMLAYNAQTKGMYDYAVKLGKQISTSAAQLRIALYNPTTGAWDGISPTWAADLKRITDGVRGEIEKIQRQVGTPFDGFGKYGGNQSDTERMVSDLAPIIRRYHPNMTDLEIVEFIETYASVGCAYMALANTLFEQYIGREAEFEARFGFPLRKANGDFNFEKLVIDFYCNAGNIGSGLNKGTQESYWEKYINAHEMYVDVRGVKVTPENWEEVSKGGHVIVSIHPVNMYKQVGGELYGDAEWRDGGHAMVITGVTPEGYFIVSSWSGIYYINPNDPVFKESGNCIYYQQASYS